MLFTSKNKSDVILKGQRIQCFLRENINHAKTKHVRVNSKRFAKFDTREGTTVIPRHASLILRRSRGPFLERPGNLTGPKSYFEIKVLRKIGCVLTSNEVDFFF